MQLSRSSGVDTRGTTVSITKCVLSATTTTTTNRRGPSTSAPNIQSSPPPPVPSRETQPAAPYPAKSSRPHAHSPASPPGPRETETHSEPANAPGSASSPARQRTGPDTPRRRTQRQVRRPRAGELVARFRFVGAPLAELVEPEGAELERRGVEGGVAGDAVGWHGDEGAWG